MKDLKKLKIRASVLLASLFVLALPACSVVFTGSISGQLVDREIYDNGSNGSGITDAEIFLYTDVDTRNADYDAWIADSSVLPDNPVEGEPKYFLKTISDDQGDYSFNGFIWNELFPDYGKSGDRKDIYMLFYHREYGLVKTPYPIYVVSDVTNRIPLFKLAKILNTADIAGSVSDAGSGDAVANVNVRIWVPVSWSYDSNGNITSPVWDDTPAYTAVSDSTGSWSRGISYAMMPSSTDNRGSTIVRITYSANGYIAENAADPEIIDGGWDMDSNGTVDSDEDTGYFQSSPVNANSYTDFGDIALADEYNNAGISGKVINSSTGEGEQNVSVRIYVAEDWSYTSADPNDIEAASGVDWPANPQYTLNTDANGDYSTDIRFDRKPSGTDNRGTVRVRLVFVKNNFRIDSTTDAKLTDNPSPGGSWDRDGNGTVDADEDDAFYDPVDVVTADLENDLGSIVIKQTEFNETLNGEVWNRVPDPDVLVNGVEVWLFFKSDTTIYGTTPPAGGDGPDYITTTNQISNPVTSELEKGRFSFSGLQWTDDTYTGNQSKAPYYIYLPDATEIANGTLTGGLTVKRYLTSGADNYVSLDQ